MCGSREQEILLLGHRTDFSGSLCRPSSGEVRHEKGGPEKNNISDFFDLKQLFRKVFILACNEVSGS